VGLRVPEGAFRAEHHFMSERLRLGHASDGDLCHRGVGGGFGAARASKRGSRVARPLRRPQSRRMKSTEYGYPIRWVGRRVAGRGLGFHLRLQNVRQNTPANRSCWALSLCDRGQIAGGARGWPPARPGLPQESHVLKGIWEREATHRREAHHIHGDRRSGKL
jgi:hypothetical protein